MLSQAPILVPPQPKAEFMLDTDANNEGIGANPQIQDGNKKVTAFGSKD